jgi:hypothetical protein
LGRRLGAGKRWSVVEDGEVEAAEALRVDDGIYFPRVIGHIPSSPRAIHIDAPNRLDVTTLV